MHAIQGGWQGQTFALATSNDAGGKKSRIRRSKEERKTMVQSFIKKYQKSNNGNFPSLNLTHKEVGGSFYTVREIVREIIQENRVLAPPNKFLDEHYPSGFTEQGSSSLEHKIDFLAPKNFYISTPFSSPTTNVELMPSSSLQFSDPELNDEQGVNELCKVATEEKVCEEARIAHPLHYKDIVKEDSNSWKQKDEFDNKNIINESEGIEDNTVQKPLLTNFDSIDADNSQRMLQSSQKNHDFPETQGHGAEQYLDNTEQIVDKLNGTEKQAHTESADMEIISKVNFGDRDKEAPQVAITTKSSSAVEILPVQPISRTADVDGESGISIRSEKVSFIESNMDVVNGKDEQNHKEVSLKLENEHTDEKSVQNLHDFTNDHGSKSSLLDETKVGHSSTNLVSGTPPQVGTEADTQNKNGLQKMDRINLETWKGSKKSSRIENNPILALVKTFLSALVKFLNE
ncbi:uncharacterized protein LOC127241520 [Andrographis paniculata]|uniref:uncharacterized protein LOC127241520 n=1 Tax=Andrographis paniculata TaxID=175694 RepID=UPI0021E92D57|nr:uncharacterized protein LOC127241520 [Andrographis paniculata]XP_051116577.1 uncharacterized protein LOC127241520 [Andrographis paniculata]XP_051116578.1 uncharacterized protein LOC127241520 [Andrographis paniculata]XP_051116579.1 uncharacterized protein LOC127241520 [Andrographis paniculata]XP_051116580.1 uncharacterized protein LOC127241520 [Andrographis paniculata]XP_051116581.1 uncharacterized protein LOC127241520 [Andrographis paniculata]